MVFSLLAGVAGSIGPLALAGGPIGIGLAWLGSVAANKTVKIVAISFGLLLLIGTTAAIAVHWQHLERDSAAYKTLSERDTSLEQLYGCPDRPVHERDLAACLVARDRDASAAVAIEIGRQLAVAAREQADLDRTMAGLEQRQREEQARIDADALKGDGPVGDVLLNGWRRGRAAKGLK